MGPKSLDIPALKALSGTLAGRPSVAVKRPGSNGLNYAEFCNKQRWAVLHYRTVRFLGQEFRASLPTPVLSELQTLLNILDSWVINESDNCQSELAALEQRFASLVLGDDSCKAIVAQVNEDLLLTHIEEAQKGIKILRQEPGLAERPEILEEFENNLSKVIESYCQGERSTAFLMKQLQEAYEKILLAIRDPFLAWFQKDKQD